jgi:hypothetical protein
MDEGPPLGEGRRKDANAVGKLVRKLERFGLEDKLIIFRQIQQPAGRQPEIEFLNTTQAQGMRIFTQAELLLNFCYFLGPEILSQFRRTALVDIDLHCCSSG